MSTTITSSTAKTLGAHITETVQNYLNQLDGNDPIDLYNFVLEEVEMPFFRAVMDYTNGNQVQAAQISGISRGTLRKKLKKYFGTTLVGRHAGENERQDD